MSTTTKWNGTPMTVGSHFEWNSGDVAVFTDADGNTCRGVLSETREWVTISGVARVVDIRPLVVLDPSDEEQVRRFVTALTRVDFWAAIPAEVVSPVEWRRQQAQTVLREFVAPPKPAEPRGLGAVVEDHEGDLWVRLNDTHWHSESSPNNRKTYGEIDTVRVLQEGVR